MIRRFLERARRQDEFDREMESYIAHETDENIAKGMNPALARQAALRKFGNRTAARERIYDMNSVRIVDTLAQNVRYGLRQLRLQPGFAAVAILSLALGIGANTAIFTLAEQIMLRQLPVERPGELVQLRVSGGRFGSNSGDGLHTFAYPTYLALRDRSSEVFSGLTGQRIEGASLMLGDRNEFVNVGMVAGNYFDVFGVRAHLGRLLTADDDRVVNGHPVAVLQYDFWRNRLAARADIVGQSIRINGANFAVIGVAAQGFDGTDPAAPNKLWVPIQMRPTITPTTPRLDDERSTWFYLFARRKPGVTTERAETAMKVLYRERQEEELKHPLFSKFPNLREPFLKQSFGLDSAARGDSFLRETMEPQLKVLQWLVGAVLLIACSNVAGLLLARGAARQRELNIRGALGASRVRIAGQLLTESVLLAAAGGLLGLGLGSVLTRGLIAAMSGSVEEVTLSAAPNLNVLLFALAVTTMTTLLLGVLPAWQNSRAAGTADALREQSGAVTGARGQVRLRKAFVGLQVGLAMVLLLAAGLFARSLRNLASVDLGLKTDNVVQFTVRPAEPYDTARKAQAYRALMEGLARVPGVKAVGANNQMLFAGGRSDGSITIPGLAESRNPQSFFNLITPGYLEALGIPVKAGRGLNWNDWNSGRKLAVVNETLVGEYFDGTPPVGRQIGNGMRVPADVEIVGVMKDARYHRIQEKIPPQTFFNMDAYMARIRGVNVYAKASGDPRQIMSALRAEAARIDPNFVINAMRTMDAQVNILLARDRLISFLSAGFAILATVLAVIGLHGVLAYVVARRTREFGVRIALGAGPSKVARLVASETSTVVLAGLVAGATAGYWGGRYVESLLFGLKGNDATVFGAALLALALAAGVATLLPAWRACRIDPIRALRQE